MIETFIIEKLCNNNNDDDEKETFANMRNYSLFTIIVALLISLAAAYFAYQCNYNETGPTRLVYTIIAFLFPGLYLLYFFIRYVLLGQNCGKKNMKDLLAGLKKLGK